MSYFPASSHRLLLVTFTFRSSSPKVQELVPSFNKATDWYRYAPNSWIVWTNGSPSSWYNYLKPQIPDSDYIFIVEINPSSYNGWLPQGAVDWLKKYVPAASSGL
jgi:hypothetical protein